MKYNLFYFVALNFISYLIFLSIWGFEAAYFVSIIWSLIIIIYNYKDYGFKDSLVLAIIYLLVFDSKVFYISSLNLRVWYFYLIVVIVITWKEIISKGLNTFNRVYLVEYIFGSIFFIWSFIFLLIDNFDSKINNIKYWLFYIGLLYVLNNFFKKQLNNFWKVIDFVISITVFIAFWGIFQFIMNILFIPNFQLDFYNIRPSAFFSETTWYSEFIFFGLILLTLRILQKSNGLRLLFLVPFFTLGIILSVTRNTYLALFIFIFLSIGLSIFVEQKIYIKIIRSKAASFFFLLTLISLIYFFPKLSEVSNSLFQKFSFSDNSALGRIEAIDLSMKLIHQGRSYGNGFYWDKSQVTQSGSAIGSKSFNLFLMIASIFGYFGGLIFVLFILYYLFKLYYFYIKYQSIYIKYSFIFFFIFIQMSMFAPLHQYPIGILIISISVFLFNKGLFNHGRNIIRATTV